MTDEPTNVDTIKQWGIKTIPARVIKEISDAAYDRKITNGQMIELLWEHWKADGEPVQLNEPSALSEDQLTARMQAVAALMQGLAAVKTATGRASGRDVVMGAVWKLKPERRRLAARANGKDLVP